MKTTGRIISALLALLLLLTGCTSGGLESSSGSGLLSNLSSEGSSPEAPSEGKKLTGGKLVEPIVVPGLTDDKGEDVAVLPFPVYDGKVAVHLSEQCKNEDGEYLDVAHSLHYSYDLNTQEVTYMGRIDYVHYGPNNYLVMKDRYLYQAVHAGGSLIFCGFSLNGEKEKMVEPGGEETKYSSLWRLSKLNDREIVIHGWDFIQGDDDIVECYIKKYNVDTGAYDELVRTSHNRTADQGKDIIDVYCSGGQIFAYTSFPKRGIEVYDGDGNCIKSYGVETIEREIRKLFPADSGGFGEMKVYGDYFVVRTYGNAFIFRSNSDDVFEKVAVIEGCSSTVSLENREGAPEYLMLIDSEEFQVFDFKTETVQSFEFALDEQCRYFDWAESDDEGNVMLVLSSLKGSGEDVVTKYFYFSADELRKQLAG